MNCPVAEAAFGPLCSVAEEINTINGENLHCDAAIWEGLGGRVTACPPGLGGEGRTQQGLSPAGGLRGQSGPRGLAGQDWVKVRNEGDTLRKHRDAISSFHLPVSNQCFPLTKPSGKPIGNGLGEM